MPANFVARSRQPEPLSTDQSDDSSSTASSNQKRSSSTSSVPRCSNATDVLDGFGGHCWWTRDQIQRQPQELFSVLPDYTPGIHLPYSKPFADLWRGVSLYVRAEQQMSINDITSRLCEDGILQQKDEREIRYAAQSLVFAVIGWQTLLYQPDLRSCPPSQLAIKNEMGLHQGYSRICIKQDLSACKRSLPDFLLGFGVLLPPENFNLSESCDSNDDGPNTRSVSAVSLNAHLLTTIGDINVEWVDSLSCHLEFDAHNRKLFLFRYPTFCARCIPPVGTPEALFSPVHACAARVHDANQWANANEVTGFFHETILSYRLLFGQNKKARRLYRRLKPFKHLLAEGCDKFLDSLCGQGQLRVPSEFKFVVREREDYDLAYDFPVLGPRLAVLAKILSEKKPQTWKELWNDKRDSASWLTLWAVLIFGILGTILALLQVIFQMIQVFQQ